MKILVVGLGSIGRRHLQNLGSLGIQGLLALRVRNLPLPDSQALPGFEIHSSLDEALAENPLAVLICNPPHLHVPVAVQAAQAGCHLFVEKPLSHSMNGVDELLSLVRKKGLVALVGLNMRFHPGLQLVKSLLEENRIGRVLSVQAQLGQYLPDWRPEQDYRANYGARRDQGGGVILDVIHELDYIQWLIGKVHQVGCLAGHVSSLEIETEDVAEIQLLFKNGAIGNVHLDYLQRSPIRTCRIVGEEGTIVWDYYQEEVQLFEASRAEWQTFALGEFERNDMFVAEMRHFLACLEGRETPSVSLEEGVEVLKMALAAHQSAETGTLRELS